MAVKQYESYNRGLALTELSFAPIGCHHRSLSSDWSRPGGALSCYNRGVLASLKDVGRNVYTWDPPGLRKCALKETCLARPAEWRHPCHAFLLVGQPRSGDIRTTFLLSVFLGTPSKTTCRFFLFSLSWVKNTTKKITKS